MPTSSIFNSVKINDPDAVERLVNILEEADSDDKSDEKKEKPSRPIRVLRSPEEIRAFFNGDKESFMPLTEVVRLLKVERECIKRNENKMCNRDCAKCDLVQNTDDLISAYTTAILFIEARINKAI